MIKTTFYKLTLILVASFIVCIVATACQNNESDKEVMQESYTYTEFISTLHTNVETFMDANIVAKPSEEILSRYEGSLLIPEIVDSGKTKVYIDFEDSLHNKEISTPREILDIIVNEGAIISLTNDGFFNDSIYVSEDSCRAALNPLLIESKKYLYGKGFSDDDIQQMLEENNADETMLVPLVMALVEEEKNQELSLVIKSRNSITTCAMQAIGLDIVYSLTQSSAKTWSKKVIKKLFKTVAKRALGPVGVAIAVVEFTLCMERS